MSYNAFMDSTRCNAVRHLHETEMLMHITHDYRERARRYQRGYDEAQARYLAAEARYQASEAERQVLQEKVGASEERVRALTAELDEEKGAHTLARSELRAAEARLAAAELALASREQEVENARLRHLELERGLNNLERKAAYHEARELEAREQAQNAVRLFRESEEFHDLLAEEGVNGLIQGFRDFRNQLRRLLPDFDVNLLQPGAGVERGDAAEAIPEVTEVASEVAPAAAEAAEEAPIGEPATPGAAGAEVVELET
ncbi:uncharacterized protein LOC120112953 [Phoenix dactylifera]|uniref:Uncharacterized protein LOC120112953 n=1 Tax=Phoenix dactylifera TaxID=42345 RepID=A0A8B9B071_PHODC|nr:uncharacterized protein LOC120112953 [Phoenix dactylifera]